MEATILEAQLREVTGKKVSRLRNEGLIPAVVYGIGNEPQNLSVGYPTFEKLYRDISESTLVDLKIDGKEPLKVLMQDVQFDPILGRFLHIDFRQVDMKEEVETEVELVFDGEAPAVKALGGILVRNMDTVTVRCLPGDLVNEIMVDMSTLKAFGDAIHMKDLAAPQGITLVGDLNELVVVVNEPISEEELKSLDEAPVEDVNAVKTEAEEKAAEEASEGSAE